MADFVIVGAGSAGCVLAEALSSRHSVVLIEAGGSDRFPEVSIPAAFSKLFKTKRDWGYQSQPESGAESRSLFIPRGKMVGGSSSMNAMLYIRGRPSDYDGWEQNGANGWGWDQVFPIFREMETNARGANEAHGDSGPLLVEDIRQPNLASRRFVEAAMATGIPPNHDFNDGTQPGVGYFQVTQKRRRRWSAADAFLRPALRRPTLELLTEAVASKVVIEHGRAVGIDYLRHGQSHRAKADREVILAAGAIGSPHLLQLSGVGDPDHLRAIGIEPTVDNRGVGRNFHDHPVVPVIYESKYRGTLDDAESLLEMAKWLLFRTGRLTSPVAEACAFIASSAEVAEPDLQFHFGPVNFDNHGLTSFDGHAFTIGPVLVNPKSRGSVLARSDDPISSPAIQVNCLVVQSDVDALIRGVEIAREIVSAEPFDDIRSAEIKPGDNACSPADLETAVRRNVELLYHPVGTCRMGSDEHAVVDPQLRVNGVAGLRVVDASVMPTVISGNTNAPTMMVAARGADLIIGGG